MDLGIEDDWFAGKNEPVEPAEPKDMYHEDLKAESDIDPLGEQFFISKPSVFEQEADAFTHTAGATIKDAPAGVGRGVQEALIETAAATSEITTALSGRTSPALTKWLDEQRARVKEAEQAAGEKGVIPIVPVLTSFMLPFSGAMKVLRLVNFAGKLSKGAGMATALGIKARHGASATATLTHKGYQLGRRVDRLTQGVQTVIAASVAGALSSSPEEETLSGAVIDPETSNEMAASIRRVMAAEQGSAEETAAEQAMRRLRNRGRHAAEMAMLTIVIEATLGSIKMLKGRVKEEQPNASPEDILKIMTSAPEMKSKAPKMSQEVTTFHERTAKEGMRIHREAMKNSVASGEVKRGDPIIHPDEYNELVAELQAEGITVPGEKGITRRDFLKGSAATVAATATAAMAVKLGLPPAATTAEVAEAATAAGVPMPAFSSFITDRNAGVLEEKIGDIVRNKAGSWSLSDSVSGMGEAGSGIGPQGYLMPDGTWAEGSVYDDGAYYGQYMAEQLGAEPWYDTIEEVAEMDRYAMMHAEGIPLINPENTPAMISDIVSVEVAEARGWDDNKVDDIISMEVSAPLNEKQINALKVAIGEGRIVDVMFISKPSINTGHQKIGEKTYIDPKDLDAFNADLELARAKHPVNAQGQPLIVKRPLPFDELTSKGGMRRARDAKTSLEAVISGESPAQNLDIDQFSALSEAYETGELTRRLDEAGLSYIDDMMGTLHVGKTPELAKAMQDVHDDIMRQDANTYDIGLLYGYSEGDIAHFYQVRGYGEKAFNEDRKNSEVAPLLDVMNVRERLPGPEATQRLEDAITERAVEMRKSIDKGLNNIINLADKRPAAGSMTDLEIVMDEIGAILKTGKPGDPFVDRATEELQKLNAGITKRGEAAKEAGARLEAIKEQLLAGELSARDAEALMAEMKAKFLSEQITPEETVEYTQRVLDVLRSGQDFPANDLYQMRQINLRPAVRDPETGKVFEGVGHSEAYQDALEGTEDVSVRFGDNPEEGYVDGSGNFLTRGEADARLNASVISEENITEAFPMGIVTAGDTGFHVDLPQGHRIKVNTNQTITVDEAAAEKAYGEVFEGGAKARGAIRIVDRDAIMWLASDAAQDTVHHEAFHAATRMVLTPREYKATMKDHGSEEAAAKAYAEWDQAEAPNTIFQKIKDFFKRIREWLFPTAEGTFSKVRSGYVWSRTDKTVNASKPSGTVVDDAIDYQLRSPNSRIEVDVPSVTKAMKDLKPIPARGIKSWATKAKKAGVPAKDIKQGVERLETYNRLKKNGTIVILQPVEIADGEVVFRTGVLNTAALEGLRKERVDKVVEATAAGDRKVEVGAIREGGRSDVVIPTSIRGKIPRQALQVPSTDPTLQRPKPKGLNDPLVVTGNPHMHNFRRPHPSWDKNITAVRVKPVLAGSQKVNQAVADSMNYANEIGATPLITTFRSKQLWELARHSDVVPTSPKDPDFDKFWKKTKKAPPSDPRTKMDYTPYLPKPATKSAFREAGWDIQKNVFGEGGTWWWPSTKELPQQVKDMLDNPEMVVEYCDLFGKGCPVCRNCQKLTFPKSAGAMIMGITDEMFCEMGCPQCFVRNGQSGIKGRMGITVKQNLKQQGFGEKDLGDIFPRTVDIMQKVVRDVGAPVKMVSKFMRVEDGEKLDIAMSLFMDGRIDADELTTIQDEVLRGAAER